MYLPSLVGKRSSAGVFDDDTIDPDVRTLRQETIALRRELQGLSTKIDRSQQSVWQAADDDAPTAAKTWKDAVERQWDEAASVA